VPELKASYARPKEDYRAAARLIAGSGHPDTVVLALGQCAPFVMKSLEYYFWRERSSVVVALAPELNRTDLNNRVFEALGGQNGDVWGAVFAACDPPDDFSHAENTDVRIVSLPGLSLIRSVEKGSPQPPFQQAVELLNWASVFQPDAAGSAELLGALSRGRLGENELPEPRAVLPTRSPGWSLGPGIRVSGSGREFVLQPAGLEINVTATAAVKPGTSYVLSFRWRGLGFSGEQRVSVATQRADGSWNAVFPNGGGYQCAPGPWRSGAFTFTIPPHTTTIQVWLRAKGAGTAYYGTPTLRQLLQ
jgi:hypothetical protein